MAAPFDDSEHARIARSNSLQDYMSIPWNDDFRMFLLAKPLNVVKTKTDINFILHTNYYTVMRCWKNSLGNTFLYC